MGGRRLILDLEAELASLVRSGASTNLRDALALNASKAFRDELDEFLRTSAERCVSRLGYALTPLFCRAISLPGVGDLWDSLGRYCARVFPGDDYWQMCAPHHLWEILASVFDDPVLGARFGRDIARKVDGLVFDDDDLVVPAREGTQFERSGALIGSSWLLYGQDVPGQWQSGGFVERLLRFASRVAPEHLRVRLAIDPDVILDRSRYFEVETRAWIRGPRGIDAEVLSAPNFPADPTGTVTEHRRMSDDIPVSLFPLERLEVMWSKRGPNKQVELEELRPAGTGDAEVGNRYVHSYWAPDRGCFTHLDGAVRWYPAETYDRRLESDLRRYERKASRRVKSFLMDGDIPIDDWSDLVVRFFDPNELVLEYLGGPNEAS